MEINVYVVRHGETTANRSRIIQGHRDYKLNENGILQAIKAGEGLQDVPFDDVYVSDLSRAYDTATAIVKKNKYFTDPSAMRVWKVMRERTFGIFEGQSIDVWNAEAKLRGHSDDLWQLKPAKGESLDDLRMRAGKFFELFVDDLANNWDVEENPNVLVVSHGVFMKELMIYLAEYRDVPMPCKGKDYRLVSPNSGITRFVLSFDEAKQLSDIKCISMNDVAHLGGMEALSIEKTTAAKVDTKTADIVAEVAKEAAVVEAIQ